MPRFPEIRDAERHFPLATYFDSATQARMARSTQALTWATEDFPAPLIVSAHPTSAHRAFVAANARHNNLTELASHHRSDGWTTTLYELALPA